MADFYIQFRHTKPNNSDAPIGDVIAVYEDWEIVEPPSQTSNGHLAWVKVTGMPSDHTKQTLFNLLAGRVEVTEDNWMRKSWFNYGGLPVPYKEAFDLDKQVDIPFGLAVVLFFHRGLGRNMNQGDF